MATINVNKTRGAKLGKTKESKPAPIVEKIFQPRIETPQPTCKVQTLRVITLEYAREHGYSPVSIKAVADWNEAKYKMMISSKVPEAERQRYLAQAQALYTLADQLASEQAA